RPNDVAASAACLPVRAVQRVAELRGEHQVVAVAPQQLAEEVFGLAVDVRGVDKRYTFVHRGVDHGAGRVEIDASAEVVAAEANGRDDETGVAEPSVLHGLDLRRLTQM